MPQPRYKLTLTTFPNLFAVCRLDPNGFIPHWALLGDFVSLTRTSTELSIICPQENVPEDALAERGWRYIKVEGRFDFSIAGVHASVSLPLAEANISTIAVATYDTDHVFIKEEELEYAVQVLMQAGHTVRPL